jgi:hypothetical protein
MNLDLHRLGTYNAIDRSKQYTRADAPELLRSLNEAWTKIRTLESANHEKEKAIIELRNDKQKLFKLLAASIGVTSLVTALVVEFAKALITYLTW